MKTINGIFKLMLGTSAIILAVAALSYTSTPAHAENNSTNENMMLPQPGQSYGKYRVQYVCGLDGNSKFFWHICATNTETGKFKVFRWSKDSQDWVEQFGKDIPSLP